MGVHCKDGIILGNEKIVVGKMMLPGTDQRIWNINMSAGCTANGLVPDGKSLMYRGREESKQYQKMYGITMPGKVLSERLAMNVHMNTIYARNRPYGSSVIMATYDELNKLGLYMIEPSGASFQYYGCASGRGKQLARNEIEKKGFRDMTCE